MPLDDLQLKSSPYEDYRLAVWRAWNAGMTGFGYWVYNYSSSWDGAGGRQYAVVYRTNAADCPAEVSKREPVIPSKRWEATREGLEDCAYLHLLRRAIDDWPPGTRAKDSKGATSLLASWTEKVLNNGHDPLLADEAKTQIIKAIIELSRGQ